MVLTIGAHNLVVGDVISLADQSLTFTCAMDGHGTQHTYPRAYGYNAPGGIDPAQDSPLFITSVDATTITVNVGISSNTSAHTFVSATADAVTAGFEAYTFDATKCQRDVGYLIEG